jgi:hypothetical protein
VNDGPPEAQLCLWYDSTWEFYNAAKQLDTLGLVPYSEPGEHYILLKERGTDRMGFGFYDLELGLMCKMAL